MGEVGYKCRFKKKLKQYKISDGKEQFVSSNMMVSIKLL